MPPQSGARVLRFLEKGRLKTDKVRFSGAKPMNPTQTHSLPCANAGEGLGWGWRFAEPLFHPKTQTQPKRQSPHPSPPLRAGEGITSSVLPKNMLPTLSARSGREQRPSEKHRPRAWLRRTPYTNPA
ncbi:hypothetical protein [Kingella potus]|uniref:hypothetical protein n=1 Tax=Kingella potus TaxID=265175 RepID=UPI001FCF93D4|nr:hypothetical protein [Kingella potus]UOP00501.1 hypothetical protein LVJ84_11720 [Kingella potus]